MKGYAACYDELLAYCGDLPLVDTHDHASALGPRYTDPIQVVIGEYLLTDLQSATSEANGRLLLDHSIGWQERWPVLEHAWSRSKHSGYAQVTRRVLQHFYGETEVTYASLERISERLMDLEDEDTYVAVLDEAGIVVRIEDVWPDVRLVLDGTLKLTPRGRLAISLPQYHSIRSYADVQAAVSPLNKRVRTLPEYIDACSEIFEGYINYGAICFKDQSAYARSLDYGNPTYAEAEAVFNRFMDDPQRSAGYPDGIQPLDDYLFHVFLDMAAAMNLPVQLHTGHLAGLYGDIRQANAAPLAGLLLLHHDVQFDLFHANWPYGGEAIYLAKNFPNVRLNFCWTNTIDPLYCQNLFKQALSSLPHSKIHGFGSDYGGHGYYPGGGYVDRAWAHASIARENIAVALSDMVDMQYLSLDEARDVAYAWLYQNPNEFYQLGL